MAPFEYLKEFVNERLTAAAEEIFGVFKRTIDEYEEELVRLHKMLANVRTLEIKLLRTGENLLLTPFFNVLHSVVSGVANWDSCCFLIGYFGFCVSPKNLHRRSRRRTSQGSSCGARRTRRAAPTRT